ncbi:serine/threonine-protein phosphatase 4 regulatory subunit 3A-like isoform X1 [Ruditapes philippinarum]|uniref:serine/threonine-protein phosphatase 4 regulatory subunit 3A-like isoform X1 n=1 Tax=Ruditapes philippinarum TaxID=129788 RepID=UPI00295C2E07|nr:serine/threonine-protein phosphatase 4 regulatory subunit 3A-like isoform X1 [Ruditapes philippinarum]XP_060552503.1 serine/threonine-protein phosphatase 4 regulatory subunit 3A-like isoform X1 [Ruditapes philippinarum]
MADTSTRRRVKLYMLNEERQWDDRGTGHVSSAYVERLKGMSLLVRSETDGSILLESKIQPDTAYQKQQETLIVWSEGENYDLALSFQEKAGCDEIWEKICNVQGKDPSVDITQDIIEESEDERFEEMPEVAHPIDLPVCELSKLVEISELFGSVLTSPIRREKLALVIEQDGYIKKLLDLFHMCEDLENIEGLHHLYDIFKSVFLLNKNALFEILFQEDTIFDVVGVLEYDPSHPLPAKHREYLQKTAKFKEVIPFTNKELVSKIHQTYRVQYIQDVILPTPSVFEENMLSTLTSFIFFNKVEIVSMVQEDEKFLLQLFASITSEKKDDESRRDLVFFLKEFCTFSQNLQPPNRDNFFKTLSGLGVLPAIEFILGLDDIKMKSAAIDIFSYIVEFSPSMVREFILKEGQNQEDDDLLINLVIEQMINDPDTELGGAVQLMGIIRLLIDPENMLATTMKTEKTEFLSFFYKHSMHVLTAPLFAVTAEEKPSKDDFQTAQLLSLILELLSFCVEHHTYHIKNYIISKDLLRRVLVLLRSRHAFLLLCALRFMRKIIGMKEDFYNRYIIKGNLFKPVVEAFKCNGNKYNLLNSAMIELFEFIRLEDIKNLCTHIVESHIKDLEHVDYVNTFESLKTHYEQLQDKLKDKTGFEGYVINTALSLRNNRFRRDQRALEEEEEMWFDQEDDVDDGENIVPMSDMLKSKLDDFDQIDKFIGNRRDKVQNDMKETPTRIINKSASPINITLKSSPLTSPQTSPERPNSPNSPGSPGRTGSACPTPAGSPATPIRDDKVNNTLQGKRPGIIGLVDYPEDDSDEEEEDSSDAALGPSPKRQRLAT